MEFARTAYRLDNSVNWVRLKSPISNYAVCLLVEKCFLYVCHFSNSKKSEYFRTRSQCQTTVGNTEFQAEHEYQNCLFHFAGMENIQPVQKLSVKSPIFGFYGFSTCEKKSTAVVGSDRSDVSKSQNDEIRAPKSQTLFHATHMQNINFDHCFVCVSII